MDNSNRWRDYAGQELDMARTARKNGNEGRARVCARRAAGHIIGEYLTRNKIDFETGSALERLRYIYSAADTAPEVRETANHFLVHTTPEYELPIAADLIADVDLLANQLLGESLD
jgi:hypothetical protein